MALSLTRRWRWAVPASVLGVVAVGAVALPVLADDPDLPERTAEQLLADLEAAEPVPMSGTFTHTADLGLPEVPQTGTGSPSLLALVGGTTSARLWYGGDDLQRLSLMGTLSETDVVRNGDDVWYWTSSDNSAVHVSLSEGTPDVTQAPATPQQSAEQALDAVDPSTAVSVDGTAKVAGRSAYELVLEPRDDATLIGQIRLAVDAETSLPLRVRVYAKGESEPSLESGFTSVSLEAPSESVFQFTPPEGTMVSEGEELVKQQGEHARDTETPEPTVVGDGWSQVFVASGVDVNALIGGSEADSEDSMAANLLGLLEPVSGSYGSGRTFESDLGSVLLLDDGRVLAGFVSVERLEQVASEGTAQ